MIRKRMEEQQEDNVYITYLGNHMILVDNVSCDRGIKEMVRLIDSKQMVLQVCKDKFKENYLLVGIEVRYQFHGTTRSALKCMIGYNHYGVRHRKINQNLISAVCLRCGEIETCYHVVQCRALSDYNKRFVREVVQKLQLGLRTEQQKAVVRNINNDLKSYLLNTSNRYQTNQYIIGWE